jgi:hypothetical protein
MINVKEATAKILKDEFGIDELTTALLFERDLLSYQGCRNLLIKEEYLKKAQPKERERLKNKLADRFCISVDMVKKIVYKAG